MKVLLIMGCDSNQYGSMEIYIVEKAFYLKSKRCGFVVIYENDPKSASFKKELSLAGAKLIIFKFKHESYFSSFFNFFKILKKEKVDILHTYFNPSCYYAGLIGRFLKVKKIFKTAANLPLTLHPKKSLFEKFLYVSSRKVILNILFDKIFCRSRAVYNEFRMIGISPKKLIITDGGVDVNFYKNDLAKRIYYRNKYNIKSNEMVIGACGRFVPQKRFDVLIDALSELKGESIKCIILGEGPLRCDLETRMHKLGLSEKVILLGQIENIADILNMFDLFISCSTAEGMSNAVLEAMSTGIPIILSDISSNCEIFDEAKARGLIIGALFKTNDYKSLSSIIIEFMKKRELLKIMGENCRRLIEERYSLKRRIEKEIEAYGII